MEKVSGKKMTNILPKVSGAMSRLMMSALVSVLFLAAAQAVADEGDQTLTVLIPAGWFVMGNDAEPPEDSLDDTNNEKPTHRVFLDSYEIDKYEVTVADYLSCVSAKRCDGANDPKELKQFDPLVPMTNVTWSDASAFCKWRGMHLPTEAEWEKAARGPANDLSPWGNRPFSVGDAAIGGRVSRVGSFRNDRSGYGVYDMAGNVMEWVSDWYGTYSAADQRNPTGPAKSEHDDKERPERVVRGAAFVTNVKYDWRSWAFSTRRSTWPAGSRSFYIGFRCARSVPSKPSAH